MKINKIRPKLKMTPCVLGLYFTVSTPLEPKKKKVTFTKSNLARQ